MGRYLWEARERKIICKHFLQLFAVHHPAARRSISPSIKGRHFEAADVAVVVVVFNVVRVAVVVLSSVLLSSSSTSSVLSSSSTSSVLSWETFLPSALQVFIMERMSRKGKEIESAAPIFSAPRPLDRHHRHAHGNPSSRRSWKTFCRSFHYFFLRLGLLFFVSCHSMQQQQSAVVVS